MLYYGRGDFENSIVEHQLAVQHNKNYAEAFNNLGIAYYAKGDLKDAADVLKKP